MDLKFKSTVKKVLFLILVSFGFMKFSYTENRSDSLLHSKLEQYKKSNPAEVVFIHTDEDVYSPGEFLYFKAYTKDYYSSNPGVYSRNLQLLLIGPKGGIRLKKGLSVKDSHSAGKLFLPGNIDEGKYTLICYTGMMQNLDPANVFSKDIYIKSDILPPLFVKLSVPDEIFHPSDEVSITVTLLKFKGKPLKRDKFSYFAKVNNSTFVSGEEKTDRDGKAVVKFKLPPDFDTKNRLNL